MWNPQMMPWVGLRHGETPLLWCQIPSLVLAYSTLDESPPSIIIIYIYICILIIGVIDQQPHILVHWSLVFPHDWFDVFWGAGRWLQLLYFQDECRCHRSCGRCDEWYLGSPWRLGRFDGFPWPIWCGSGTTTGGSYEIGPILIRHPNHNPRRSMYPLVI